MKDFINLDSGRAIREWADAHCPTVPQDKYSRPMTIQELLEIHPSKLKAEKTVDMHTSFRIEHSLGLPDGWTLVTIERVILAKDAEEALEQYIFDPDSRSIVGQYGESLAVIIRDNFRQEPQRITVYRDSLYNADINELAAIE